MHYYKRDIGKYYKKAGRLTMLQHGAYTMLMDQCYDREMFPTVEQAIDWCWASTNEEIEAVKLVLSKFFTEYDGVYKQAHITEMLDNYHKNKTTNKATAIKREADKRTKREQSVNDSNTNEHLITNKELLITNHKSITKDQNLLPENLKVSMPNDFKLTETNMSWLSSANLSNHEKQNIVQDFVDYWKLDESKKTPKGWQMAFRKNPIVKRQIVNSKHKGQNNGTHQQTNKPSLAERVTENRKRAEQQIDEQSMGKDGSHFRS